MGWFDRFKPKAEAPATAPKVVEMSPAQAALVEATRLPYAAIEIGARDAHDPRASKLGGVPYRPRGGRHDALLERNEMSFVAQLRCDELPPLPHFPRLGALQFWVVRGDLLAGIGDRDDGRVCLYYESLAEPHLEGWVPGADDEDSPLFEPRLAKRLRFVAKTACMPAGDYQWPRVLARARAGLFEIPDEDATGDRVGGYCAFTQEDPRDPDDPMLSLLQLDSSGDCQWGDLGIGHWFVREADLTARAFERVRFTWDCC
jgi:uncharacterized protein YwqG